MVRLDPRARITAADALLHPYFSPACAPPPLPLEALPVVVPKGPSLQSDGLGACGRRPFLFAAAEGDGEGAVFYDDGVEGDGMMDVGPSCGGQALREGRSYGGLQGGGRMGSLMDMFLQAGDAGACCAGGADGDEDAHGARTSAPSSGDGGDARGMASWRRRCGEAPVRPCLLHRPALLLAG